MKKLLGYLIIVVSLASCNTLSYTTTNGTKVKSILAITEVGDTVSVPYRQFVKYRDTEFMRYRHNNMWYWNNWRYNDPIFLNYYYGWNNFGYWNQFNNWYDDYRRPVNSPYVRPRVKPKPRPRPRPRPNTDDPEPRPRPKQRPNQPEELTDETNTTYPRSPRQTQTRSDGRRSRNRQIVPAQPTRSRITPPSQPRQIRRGSGQPSIQQTQPRNSSSQQRSGSTSRRKN